MVVNLYFAIHNIIVNTNKNPMQYTYLRVVMYASAFPTVYRHCREHIKTKRQRLSIYMYILPYSSYGELLRCNACTLRDCYTMCTLLRTLYIPRRYLS